MKPQRKNCKFRPGALVEFVKDVYRVSKSNIIHQQAINKAWKGFQIVSYNHEDQTVVVGYFDNNGKKLRNNVGNIPIDAIRIKYRPRKDVDG